jgi:hypothetical protein
MGPVRPVGTACSVFMERIKSKSGSYFAPRLVVLFMKLETDLRRIVQTIGLH